MNGIARIADTLVRHAASHWPAEMRESMRAEWAAELATLRDDPHLGAMSRSYRQIAFGLSLACARSGLNRDPVTGGWRRHLPASGRAGQLFGVMVGAAALAWVVTWAMSDLAYQLTTFNDVAADPAMWRQIVTSVGTQLLGLAFMVAIGAMTARRIGSADPGHSAWARAGVTVVPVGVAAYLVYLARSVYWMRGAGGFPYPTLGAAAIAAWTAVMVMVLAAAYRLVIAGRRRLAWIAGAIGSLVAVDVAGIVASWRVATVFSVPAVTRPAAFVLALLPEGALTMGRTLPPGMFRVGNQALQTTSVSYASDFVAGAAGDVAIPLLACSGFLIAYGLWRRRASVAAVAAVPAAPTARPAMPIAIRLVAAGAMLAGLALWAVMCGVPASRLDPYLDVALQLRIGAILLAVLGIGGLIVGRGPLAPSIMAGAVVLLGLDVAIARQHWSGAGVGIAAFAVGSAAMLGCHAIAAKLAGPGTNETTARRGLFVLAVIGALAVPTGVSVSDIFADHAMIPDGAGLSYPMSPPALMSLGMVVLGTLLLAVAVAYAFTSRGTRLTAAATRGFILLAIAVLAVGIVDAGAVRQALYWPMTDFFIQPILVVLIIAIARWRLGPGRLRASAWWCAAGVAAAVGSVPLPQAMHDVSSLASSPLTDAEFGQSGMMSAGNTFGAAAVGLVVAMIVARWAVPPAEPAVTDQPMPDHAGGGAPAGELRTRSAVI